LKQTVLFLEAQPARNLQNPPKRSLAEYLLNRLCRQREHAITDCSSRFQEPRGLPGNLDELVPRLYHRTDSDHDTAERRSSDRFPRALRYFYRHLLLGDSCLCCSSSAKSAGLAERSLPPATGDTPQLRHQRDRMLETFEAGMGMGQTITRVCDKGNCVFVDYGLNHVRCFCYRWNIFF
jgi:hypothetical protein